MSADSSAVSSHIVSTKAEALLCRAEAEALAKADLYAEVPPCGTKAEAFHLAFIFCRLTTF